MDQAVINPFIDQRSFSQRSSIHHAPVRPLLIPTTHRHYTDTTEPHRHAVTTPTRFSLALPLSLLRVATPRSSHEYASQEKPSKLLSDPAPPKTPFARLETDGVRSHCFSAGAIDVLDAAGLGGGRRLAGESSTLDADGLRGGRRLAGESSTRARAISYSMAAFCASATVFHDCDEKSTPLRADVVLGVGGTFGVRISRRCARAMSNAAW